MVGMSAKTYRIGDVVRKECHVLDDVDITAQNLEACRIEADVYRILGDHPNIVQCLSIGSTKDFIELQYYPNGNIKEYLEQNRANINMADLQQWSDQMIYSVSYIHSKKVIHADLRLDQWFLDSDRNVRLGDFNAAGFAEQVHLGLGPKRSLGLESSTHFLPRDPDAENTVGSDLFALGSSLYELETGKKPYEELSDSSIQLLFERKEFPETQDLLFGNAIRGCWEQDFNSASDILESRPNLMASIFQQKRRKNCSSGHSLSGEMVFSINA